MIIDFLGISGVGKTTVANQIYAQELAAGHKVEWPWNAIYAKSSWLKRNFKKAWSVAISILKKPTWVMVLSKILKKDIHISLRGRIKLIFNGIFLKSTINKCNKSSTIYLFDEGVFHFIWAAYLRSKAQPKSAAIAKIVDLFYLPNKVMVIDATADTIAERLTNRGRSTRILKSADLNAAIADNREKLATIIEIIEKKYPQVQVEYIWNDKKQPDAQSLRSGKHKRYDIIIESILV